DEVWCVFDVDEHPFVPEAKQQAKDNGIETAVSNPCFELWIILHFRDQRAYVDRAQLQHECRQYLPGYDKDVPTAKLIAHDDDAVRRAKDLDAWQSSRNCAGANPSTGVYRLTERIKAAGGPIIASRR